MIAEKVTLDLFTPPDVEDAHRLWGANCGPAALAAMIGLPLAEVRHCFPDFPGYTNFTLMQAALSLAHRIDYWVGMQRWPGPGHYGVLQVQIEGPWTDIGVPPAAALPHTHWVAVEGDGLIYDINAGWLTREQWDAAIVPALLSSHRRSTGLSPRRGLFFNRGTRAANS